MFSGQTCKSGVFNVVAGLDQHFRKLRYRHGDVRRHHPAARPQRQGGVVQLVPGGPQLGPVLLLHRPLEIRAAKVLGDVRHGRGLRLDAGLGAVKLQEERRALLHAEVAVRVAGPVGYFLVVEPIIASNYLLNDNN